MFKLNMTQSDYLPAVQNSMLPAVQNGALPAVQADMLPAVQKITNAPIAKAFSWGMNDEQDFGSGATIDNSIANDLIFGGDHTIAQTPAFNAPTMSDYLFI